MADKLAKETTEEDTSIEEPIEDFRKEFKLKTWNMTQDTISREAQFKGKIFMTERKRNRGFIKLTPKDILQHL